MIRSSYLDPSSLIAKCNSAIAQLRKDINDFNGLKKDFDDIVNDQELKGKSITALKNNLADYYICIGLTISADEQSINDLGLLKNNLYGVELLDGSVIVDKYEDAQSDYNDYSNKAEEARAKERNWSPGWYVDEFGAWHQKDESNPYTSTVKHYEAMADSSKQLMDIYKAKMDKYDSIQTATHDMFTREGKLRNEINEILKDIGEMKGDNSYVPGIARQFLEELDITDPDNKDLMKDFLESEYGQYLMDPKFFEDGDIKELEDINAQIEQMDEALAKADNLPDKFKAFMTRLALLAKKKDLIQSILAKTDHDDEFLAAYEYLDGQGYSVDELETLMWQWLKIDKTGTENEFLFPESWLEQLNHDYKIAVWTITDNPQNSYELYEGVLDYSVVCMLINGAGDTELEQKLYKELAGLMLKDENYRELVYKFAFLNVMAGRAEEVYFSDDMLDALGGLKESIIAMGSDQDLVTNAAELLGYNILEGCMNFDKMILEGLNSLTGGYIPFLQDQINVFNDSIATLDTWEGQNQTEVIARLKDILRNISGENVNDLYDLLVRVPGLNAMSLEEIKEHFEHNTQGWETYQQLYAYNNLASNDRVDFYPYGNDILLIENQNELGSLFYYGKYMAGVSDGVMDGHFTGDDLLGEGNLCEVISVYNVMTFLEGENADFPAIIRDFESKSPALGGNFGTAPTHAKEYLELMGYNCDEIDISSLNHDPNGVDDFDVLLQNYDAFILSDWNGSTVDQAMHTMAITVQKDIDPITGDYIYSIVRNNDQYTHGFTERTDAEGLYELLCEYTSGGLDDGSLMITGVTK